MDILFTSSLWVRRHMCWGVFGIIPHWLIIISKTTIWWAWAATHCQLVWFRCFNTINLLDLFSSSKWAAMGYGNDLSISCSIKWLPSVLSLYDLQVKYVIPNEIMCFFYPYIVLGFGFHLLFALTKIWVSFFLISFTLIFCPFLKRKVWILIITTCNALFTGLLHLRIRWF